MPDAEAGFIKGKGTKYYNINNMYILLYNIPRNFRRKSICYIGYSKVLWG